MALLLKNLYFCCLHKDNIFLFNDFEILGWYFVNNQIRYHLIEDGLNFFKYFNKYYQVNKVDYDINSLKVRLKNKLNIGHRAFGTNQYVIDIEVNDKNGLAIDRENIIEIPRKEINDKLTLQQKKLIYGIFCKQKIIKTNESLHLRYGQKEILLLYRVLSLS